MPKIEQAALSVVAEFPVGYFLENLAVRADGSVLVTAMNKNELWLVPAPANDATRTPYLLHTFDRMTMFVVEMDPDVFVVATADVYATNRAQLHRLDLRGWKHGDIVEPTVIIDLPPPYLAVNGGCKIAPGVLLAGAATHMIWRIDMPEDGAPVASVWLAHDNMQFRPGEKTPEQPGVNGIRFAERTQCLYYTSTAQQLMMRVEVDPMTHAAVGLPTFIAGGRYWDDFCIDEDAGVAYVTTHRENTIDRIHLAPDGNREGRSAVAGDPFTEELVGPSSAAWSREPGHYGSVAYVITDGGVAQSPDGIVRPAKLMRLTMPQFQTSNQP